MAFELWNGETANLVGVFATEDEAIAATCEVLEAHGAAYVESLFLGYEDTRGSSRLIADGKTLVERANIREPGPSRMGRGPVSHREKAAD